jgi:hypothetical protein
MNFVGSINGHIETGSLAGRKYQLEVAETGLKSNLYIDNKFSPLWFSHARLHYIEEPTISFILEEGEQEVRGSVDDIDLIMSGIKLKINGLNRLLMFEDRHLLSVEKVDLFLSEGGDSYATLKILLKAREEKEG